MEEDYSKETLEILGKTPTRFIKYGLLVIFLIVLGFSIGVFFIRYPDTFESSIELYAQDDFNKVGYTNSVGKYVAHAQIERLSFFDISINASVLIRIDEYPSNTYGVLSGNITQITYNSENSSYDVYICLSNNLLTSFNKNLKYTKGLSGTATIMGKEKSIFKRIFLKND